MPDPNHTTDSIPTTQQATLVKGYRRPRDVIHGVVILIAGVILLLAIAQQLGVMQAQPILLTAIAIASGAMILGLIVMARVEQSLRHRLDHAQNLTNDLYRQQTQRAEQLATLNRVSALLTGSLSPGEVLDTIVSSASTVSDARAVVVYLLDNHNPLSAPRLARSAGLSDDVIALLQHPIMPTAPNEDTLLPPPRTLQDIRQAHLRPALEGALVADGLLAVTELPLFIKQEELGIIALYYAQPQPFDESQIDLLQAFTTQASQAIANAYSYTDIDRALEKRVGQLYTLASFGRIINTSLDEKEIYATVTHFAQEGTHADRVALFVLDDDQHMRLKHVLGDIPRNWGTAGECDQLQQALSVHNQEPVYLPDVNAVSATDAVMRQWLSIAYENVGQSLLVVPLARADTLEAVLWLDNTLPQAFSDSDLQYIAQMSYQTMITIDNTRLFQRIRKNRDNLQVILNAMEEGILLIDQYLTIVMANPRIDLIGLNYHQLLNQSVTDVMQHDADFCHRIGFEYEDWMQLLNRIQHQNPWHSDTPHTYTLFEDTPQQTRIQRQMIALHNDIGDMTGILLVFYDKTEEYELARARDSFSQMIVHDLRSPLAAVATSLRLMSELVPKDIEARPTIDKTLDNSRRALRKVLNRVNTLLDIAKMQSGAIMLDREPTPIMPIVRNIISELNPLALELRISLEVETLQEMPFLNVDADKIERTLLNLLDNALKYNPMDSKVYIRLQTITDDTHNTWGQIDIIDHGAGIPDEYKTRLFERYAQIEGRKTTRHGVGLGLTFCKLVVEAHGGRIWVEDNPSGGSIFSLTLPAIPQHANP